MCPPSCDPGPEHLSNITYGLIINWQYPLCYEIAPRPLLVIIIVTLTSTMRVLIHSPSHWIMNDRAFVDTFTLWTLCQHFQPTTGLCFRGVLIIEQCFLPGDVLRNLARVCTNLP